MQAILIRRPRAHTIHTKTTPIDFSEKVIPASSPRTYLCERSPSLSNIVRLLVEHSLWLTKEYELLFEGESEGASKELFGLVMASWDELEIVARQVHAYRECIFGRDGRCPKTCPVTCDACVPT